MSPDHLPSARRWKCWMLLPLMLLIFSLSGQALAASGSTRLTIHLDQSVVDAIARWKGEVTSSPASVEPETAGGIVQRLLPAARAGLEGVNHPLTTERIILRLQHDALLVFDGRAEHAGSAGGACVSEALSDGRLTVHSI